MIKIIACRAGKLPRVNMANGGQFELKFRSLNHLARYISTCNRSIFFPNIGTELTKSQLKTLQWKIESMSRKGRLK